MTNNASILPEIEEDEVSIGPATIELKKFYQPLVDISQYKLLRQFGTGSSMEIPQNEIHVRLMIEASKKVLDDDYMFYIMQVYALPLGKPVPDTYHGSICRIVEDDDTHPGYVRLINENDDSRLDLSMFLDVPIPKNQSAEETEHGPAIRIDVKSHFNSVTMRYVRDATMNSGLVESVAGMFAETNDLVRSVHCPYWPKQAIEWIMRPRSNGCPSKSIIKKVINYGCDFVQVAHPLSKEARQPDANEWRFSFSKAEVLIIRSWSTPQRIHYRTLWLIFKTMSRTFGERPALCTFYFKTLMLWACENKPPKFWTDNLITDSICQLLAEMIDWLSLQFIPNYFIPDNNMMDHLNDIDASQDIDALRNSILSVVLFNKKVSASVFAETIHMEAVARIEIPSWITRTLIIYGRMHNICDNFKDLFCADYSTELHNSLAIEFGDIHTALKWQLKAMKCETKFKEYVFKAKIHLTAATSLFESNDMDTMDDYSQYLGQSLLPSFFLELPTEIMLRDDYVPDLTTNFVQFGTEMRCITEKLPWPKELVPMENSTTLGGETISTKMTPKGPLIGSNVTRYSYFGKNPILEKNCYKNWQGTSPTVNITWFLAKAFLANLYYRTERDYSMTDSVCDDILNNYRKTKYNQIFAERTFPLILSTAFTAIYDNEIQELIGFFSLCAYELARSNAFHSEKRMLAELESPLILSLTKRQSFDKKVPELVGLHSLYSYVLARATALEEVRHRHCVYIGVCPVQFALYLKCRCAIVRSLGYENWKVWNCACLFRQHTESKDRDCMGTYESRICSGSLLIEHALNNFFKKY